jgi:2-(1,2-epoxy-1,2-dihydrophenyl)acetyl-CoA isomerase
MSVETTAYERQGFYALKQLDDVATLKLGRNFLLNAIDLSIKSSLFDVFDNIAENDETRALVVMNCQEKIGCEGYIDFYRQVMANQFDRRSIQRMCNIFDQLILKIVKLNKPVIHADCGEVIPLFMNMGLACDYRIVATDTIFQKPYFELDTLPKGGSAFFLCKMMGYCQAKQLLMSDKIFNAPEALEMGIVDQVVPYSRLEEEAYKIAQDFTKRSKRSLEGIKKLINYNMKDLQDYLEFESFELLKTIGV